jgi:hypothetical protein
MSHRIKKIPFTIVCDKTNNTLATTPPTVKINGLLRGVKIKTPATVDNTATVGVGIADPDGDNAYSKTGVAVNTTNIEYNDANNQPLQKPLTGTYTINPLFSANQTTPRNVIVTLLIESFFDA